MADWLCKKQCMGRTYWSIEHHDFGDSKEPILGKVVSRYKLSEEDSKLPLDDLIKRQTQKLFIPKRQSWEDDPLLKREMLQFLAAIIMFSKEQTEVNIALLQYEKVSGHEFRM